MFNAVSFPIPSLSCASREMTNTSGYDDSSIVSYFSDLQGDVSTGGSTEIVSWSILLSILYTYTRNRPKEVVSHLSDLPAAVLR